MATFKCLASGNCVSFMEEHDIKSMMDHPGYVLVPDVVPEPVKVEKVELDEVEVTSEDIPVLVRRPGRPKKVES